MAETCDVVILGGGSGGYVAAIRAAQLGLKTTLIERHKLGGTCLHYGCIPTKAFLESAHVFTQMLSRDYWGLTADGVGYDYGKVMKFKNSIVDKNWKGVQFLMKKNKIDVVEGDGVAESPTRVRVKTGAGEQVVEGKDLIVATGSRPRTFGLPIDGRTVFTSDHAVNLDSMPGSIIILGGGVISVEFASYYHAFGVDVTIVELLPTLIPLMDADLGTELAKLFTRRGIKVLTSTTAEFESLDVGKDRVSIKAVTKGKEQETLTAEGMLVAVGREAVTGGVESLGLKLERGYIQVGDNQRTDVPHVYAIGDVCGGFGLAHEAYAEGILAVESIAGVNKFDRVDPNRIPQPVFSFPQVAAIGLREEDASDGREIEIGKFPFTANSKAPILNESHGFVKVVADKATGDILGVHMLGPNVTEFIAEAALAKFLEATPWELAYNIHPHPTLSEALGEAAHAAEGAALHM
ncbi:MAG TPA: dihydrolipoyl dehydrogenase [Chloroflexota bacterium]|jgi:dihydrolipoamide dehydrogenase|nr:dihydrolipoyl dehydrogenase [Chloroflexota bacterium]